MSHVKRMLISADPQETRVAIVDGGKLNEAYIERRGRRSITGNIYKGRVDAVLPGMEAAFIDIGLPKNGFLYVDEIMLSDADGGTKARTKQQISDLIRPGQELLVQVTKDPMGTKGARLTMDVSLAGRFMVLAPGGDGSVGVSKKLPDGERDRLRTLLKGMMTQEDAGLIARTAAQGASIDELERDVRVLEKLWEVTRGHALQLPAPALVYAEPDLALQMIRDDFRTDVSEVVIDDDAHYQRILGFVQRTSPDLEDRIKLYKGKRPLFLRYEIEQGIRSTLNRRVDLPSGGSLIVDYGEAFTVIDVNTGRFTGSKRLEDTILKNNLEAAVEVCRQLRLRDIGGIIVVDFIDMDKKKHRDSVIEILQKELLKDRSKVFLVDVSPLGLVELTRKRVADGVREIMTDICPACAGTGRILSTETIAIDCTRALRRAVSDSKFDAFEVEVHDAVATYLIGANGAGLDEIEAETGKAISVVGRPDVEREAFNIIKEGTREELGMDALAVSPGDELELPIVEPHRFAEVDAIARLRAGYDVQIIGGLPYLGTTQRIKIERSTRFSAVATLLDVEPAIAPPPQLAQPPRAVFDDGDKETDILEPERKVGERTDIEGRVRRQTKRAQVEDRRDKRKAKRPTAPAAGDDAAEGVGEPVSDNGAVPSENGDEPRKRRRRRGGRGRRPRTENGAESGSEAVAAENGDGPSEATPQPRRRRAPAAATAASETATAAGNEKPKPRSRPRAPAAVATPAEGVAANADASKPRARRRAPVKADASVDTSLSGDVASPKPRTRGRSTAAGTVTSAAADPEASPAEPKKRGIRRLLGL